MRAVRGALSPSRTAAKLGVRRQWRLAGMSCWPNGIFVLIRSRVMAGFPLRNALQWGLVAVAGSEDHPAATPPSPSAGASTAWRLRKLGAVSSMR